MPDALIAANFFFNFYIVVFFCFKVTFNLEVFSYILSDSFFFYFTQVFCSFVGINF